MWYDKLYYFAVLERGFFLMSSPKLTVAVLFGGASTEHDVSQLSVTSVLRELDRDKYPVGTQMRIQSWEHGEVYGTVAEISDTPVSSSNNPYYTSGNQNVSFYTMLIALDADSPLREDEWVDVYFNAASTASEDALCIETRFIRQDDGGSYVYRRGEDQLLHKQYVTTGVVQWGYTEIKSGLTADDWIAFPYGKNVVAGAPTESGDLSELYGY